MAALGQRIHPAGSRPSDSRHAATAAAEAVDPAREHDACGVGFVAQASGARSHEVVAMALSAVARVAHRGAASTDNSGDGAGLLTQIPHRLFYRDAYRLGLHLQPGPALRGRRVLPAARARGARPRRGAGRGGARRGRHSVSRLARRADESGGSRAHGPRVVPGDPAGAGGPSRARGGRGGVGTGAIPGATRNGAPGGAAKPARLLRLLPLLPHYRLQSPSHRDTAPRLLHRLPVSGVRERDRDLSPALLDEHAAELAPGPAVPAAGAQRRDQHAVGQPERDDHAAADAVVPGLGTEDRTAPRGHLARGQRLREPRQCDGAAHPLGARRGPHVDDDGAAGVGEVSRRRSRGEGVLRVPPVHPRAVGRTGGHRVHRRRALRRVGGPERTPAIALQGAA